MEALYEILPIIIYVLVAILLLVLIILGIKLIETVNKTNAVLDDLERKSKSLNGIFDTIDSVTDTVSLISDKLADGISSVIGKVLNFKKKKKKDEEEDYE